MLLISSRQGARPRAGGRTLLMLGSNDYLNLAGDEAVVRASIEALHRYGCGLGMNQPFATTPLHHQLTEAIAAFTGTEDAVLFSSCTAANIALLTTLGSDPSTVIVSDAHNHASIVDGCRLARAKTLVYSSMDVPMAAKRLKEQSSASARILISDGVFSVEGDIAPVRELAKLAGSANAQLVLDDSHAAGVVGARGRGTAEFAGLDPSVDVAAVTGTFSKAFGAGGGGYVAGSAALIQELRATARFYIFSTGMHVATVGAALAAIRIVSDDDERLARLRANSERLKAGLQAAGFDLLGGATPITPILVGEEEAGLRFSNALTALGIVAPLMTYPIVPRGAARVRLQPSSAHSLEDIDLAVELVAAAGRSSGAL